MNRLCLPLLFAATSLAGLLLTAAPSPVQAESTYVGTEACAECHEDQYNNFKQYAKKAKSAHSLQIMAPKLTKSELESCYGCHTTGYGKPGGFVSFEQTPHLADAGCEVCHGPGSEHVESGGDSTLIHNPELEECKTCHNEERVNNFGFRPLLHGGAH
ncbi:cytochrome c family protein [Desulfovibrio mangrovi]|uniref:cytochrome c family protein n=1 Tax=Desulfovibrio mangrovi TaxID=2976983 RepID=UPI00224656C1|nr:cytochrome c family protein [Desulfovibrio mangrovi]UZP69041.1 cytochrome c family protein [Desulfovibrio mangrovi]